MAFTLAVATTRTLSGLNQSSSSSGSNVVASKVFVADIFPQSVLTLWEQRKTIWLWYICLCLHWIRSQAVWVSLGAGRRVVGFVWLGDDSASVDRHCRFCLTLKTFLQFILQQRGKLDEGVGVGQMQPKTTWCWMSLSFSLHFVYLWYCCSVSLMCTAHQFHLQLSIVFA